ncbi:hypothetical protein SAICODRAFT_30766 [Saitoella complicata NRRL Y-17804]|uniref:uncharacterized protein n=1 Tax=Saitoella complicata (strain BCRC 22490 / CBS 7301 / JCM 7358 / NBRC 10748 / NRRL Y-17804) TaxID=698492 RepID=UPI00086722A9|nr:uncharacterized protein SAICODRAFT_30766 [Saitoella complicata NRRL Y-17804]ODQ52284.1 hypothetical protein SAICODRAFT_30766 [Saitoella complicata NRRL Y-17804]
MPNTSGDKGKGKAAPASSSHAGSSLANSAASLLRSALSPNAARDTLQSSVQSSGKASSGSSTSTYQPTSSGSTELLDDAAVHSSSSSVLTGTGFRSSAEPSNLNAEYAEFASSHQQQDHSDVYNDTSAEANIHDAYLSRALHRSTHGSLRSSTSTLHQPTRDASHDGAEILALLRDPSLNLTDEIDAVPLHSRPTKYKPTSSLVRGLQACEDPVAYIMSTNTYTEDVWDETNVDEEEVGVREAVKAAREEVRDGRKGEAVERLNMVWKHLRAKL